MQKSLRLAGRYGEGVFGTALYHNERSSDLSFFRDHTKWVNMMEKVSIRLLNRTEAERRRRQI